MSEIRGKIALIEDDQSIINLYKDIFTLKGFALDVYKSGAEGLEMLKMIREGKKEVPDLLLLDILLPDMNGVSILEEARKYPQTKGMKIFALTNYGSPEVGRKLREKGIDKILIKANYTPGQLIKIIEEALGINKK